MKITTLKIYSVTLDINPFKNDQHEFSQYTFKRKCCENLWHEHKRENALIFN